MEIEYWYKDYVDLRDIFTKDSGVICVIVTKADTRVSKSGNLYMSIELEDKSSTFSLFLFKNDIVEYSRYFHVGVMLYIEYDLVDNFFNRGEKTIKIKDIDLMRRSDNRKKMLVKGFDPNGEDEVKLFNFIEYHNLYHLYEII